MKKVCFLSVMIVLIGFGACTPLSRKAALKTEIDTLSYFYGMSRADGVKNHLLMQGVDTAFMDAFYKGFLDGVKHYSPKDLAYEEGKRIAQMISNQWIDGLNQEIFMGDSTYSVNRLAMLHGFIQGVKFGDETRIMQAQSYGYVKMESVKDEFRRQKFANIIVASEKILADNKSKPDVTTTSSGLQYKIITQGDGAIPSERALVKVHYRGTLADGTEFDSSYKNNAPASFRVNGVIKGWSEALQLMPVGSKWELYIPYNLGYDVHGSPPTIPPYATLIFEVELISIESD